MGLTRTFTVVPVVRWVVRENVTSEDGRTGSSAALAEVSSEAEADRVAAAMTNADMQKGRVAQGCAGSFIGSHSAIGFGSGVVMAGSA